MEPSLRSGSGTCQIKTGPPHSNSIFFFTENPLNGPLVGVLTLEALVPGEDDSGSDFDTEDNPPPEDDFQSSVVGDNKNSDQQISGDKQNDLQSSSSAAGAKNGQDNLRLFGGENGTGIRPSSSDSNSEDVSSARTRDNRSVECDKPLFQATTVCVHFYY